MVSNRTRVRMLGLAVVPGAATLLFGRVVAGQSTPVAGTATPPSATPARGGSAGPQMVDGRYQLPSDASVVVIDMTFGNPTLPPDSQYGYDVTIVASGEATVTISPVGSRDGDASTTEVIELATDLEEDGLQGLLAELDTLGFFALPPEDPDVFLTGGEVNVIDVYLADGQWSVNTWSLQTDEQRERFDAAHLAILQAVGIEEPPDLGR